jgi:adenylosuccinate synthase
LFDSLKKKFADASGKLRNKVEDEAKEENNVEFIEEFTGTKVGIVSVGAERNQTFVREEIWK